MWEKLPKDRNLHPKKEAVATGSPPEFFGSIFRHQKFGKFSYKIFFFEFTLGIKNRKNLWIFFLKKQIAEKRKGGPIIVHLGASSVQLFMNITNWKLPHPVGSF